MTEAVTEAGDGELRSRSMSTAACAGHTQFGVTGSPTPRRRSADAGWLGMTNSAAPTGTCLRVSASPRLARPLF
ncbi:hypothetical protein [Streptomyces sp. NBC_00280]|uniref:hypothetical protein n=1 Tax=Streptomyces sp. NBC_00280 TaxID=2975699 RepID=UPI00324E322D